MPVGGQRHACCGPTDQFEAAGANAAAFLEHFPDNPVALAESAILAALDDQPATAMQRLQRAMAAVERNHGTSRLQAMGIVAECHVGTKAIGTPAGPSCTRKCSWPTTTRRRRKSCWT